MSPSPYEVALDEAAAQLHPSLRAYFAEIPPARVGRGEGVFDVFGCPRRWLRPLLRHLDRAAAVAAAWAQSVPFTVLNRPFRRTDGAPGVAATRTVPLPGRSWSMVDAVTPSRHGVVDRIGQPVRVAAEFAVSVRGGALVLRSRRVRLGRMPIPAPLRPRVELVERFDDAAGRQQVSLRMTLPLVGVIYEYRGHFDYRLEDE